jgi:hypothetical protein
MSSRATFNTEEVPASKPVPRAGGLEEGLAALDAAGMVERTGVAAAL